MLKLWWIGATKVHHRPGSVRSKWTGKNTPEDTTLFPSDTNQGLKDSRIPGDNSAKCHAELVSASNKIKGVWDPESSSG